MRELSDFPSVQDFYIASALYKEFASEDPSADTKELRELFYPIAKLDAHCSGCGRPSIFAPRHDHLHQSFRVPNSLTPKPVGPAIRRFVCERSEVHVLTFAIMALDSGIMKIGQHPSLRDLAHEELRKYRKPLADHYDDLSAGVGLAAHGVGIGSFVYLRRVLEGLIEEAHAEARKADDWDEDRYPNRVTERIVYLKAFLPSFMSEHPSVYSILSKGIHELTEDECLQHFDLLRNSIELILDQRIEAIERSAKEKAARSALSQVSGQVNKRKNEH
jgi:hypothetical protein